MKILGNRNYDLKDYIKRASLRMSLAFCVVSMILNLGFYGAASAQSSVFEKLANLDVSSDNQLNEDEIVLEILIDSSQKMRREIGDLQIMDLVVDNIGDFLGRLPGNVKVAVRTYGHRAGTRERPKSCQDSELIQPVAETDRDQLVKKLSKLSTKGFSPLAHSLEKISSDVPEFDQQKTIVMVLSAGPDSCDGDVKAAAQTLKTQNTGIIALGFNLFGDNELKTELMSITDVYDTGKVWDITDEEELMLAFQEANELIDEQAKSEEDLNIITDIQDDDSGLNNEAESELPESGNEESIDGESIDGESIDDEDGIDDESDDLQVEDQDLALKVSDFFESSLFKYLMGAVAVVAILLIGIKVIIARKTKEEAIEQSPIAMTTEGNTPKPQASDVSLPNVSPPDVSPSSDNADTFDLSGGGGTIKITTPEVDKPVADITGGEQAAQNADQNVSQSQDVQAQDVQTAKAEVSKNLDLSQLEATHKNLERNDTPVSLDRMIEPKEKDGPPSS